MADSHTPYLHLGLTDDERVNRNLTILDAVMARLDRGAIIPEDLLVQGNLDVLGNAHVTGDLSIDGVFSANFFNLSNFSAVNALINNLEVDGTIQLPPKSVSPDSLDRGASLFSSAVGTARTSPLPLVDFESREICAVDTEVIGDPAFPALVLGVCTVQFSIGGSIAGPRTLTATLMLKQGSIGVQLRSTAYTWTIANGQTFDVPLLFIYFGARPGTTPRWSIEGGATGFPGGGGVTVQVPFAQLFVLEPR